MAIGPNSKWRCNPGCDCSQKNTKNQHRCRKKVDAMRVMERLPEKMFYILWKMDLGVDKGQTRFVGYWRTMIKEWMWVDEQPKANQDKT